MNDYCDRAHSVPIVLSPTGNMSAILIKLKRETYKANMDCTISLRAPPNYGLMAFITKLKLRRFNAQQADMLEFTSNNLTLLRMHGLNQEVVPRKTILTGLSTNQLDVHFLSDNTHRSLAGKGFKIVINLYTNVAGSGCDGKLGLDFNCGNDICIHSFLECDGINNCRNNEDELECDETSETKLSLYVFLCTIVVMVILVMMFMMKNKDKRKEIVRRMSRVYANNNPILFVMDGNDSDSQSGNSLSESASPLPTPKLEHQPPHTQQAQRMTSVRSKLSLSLPQGIDQVHVTMHNNDKANNI